MNENDHGYNDIDDAPFNIEITPVIKLENSEINDSQNSLRSDVEMIRFPDEIEGQNDQNMQPILEDLNSDESVSQHNRAFIQYSTIETGDPEEAHHQNLANNKTASTLGQADQGNGSSDGQIFGTFNIGDMLNEQDRHHANQG